MFDLTFYDFYHLQFSYLSVMGKELAGIGWTMLEYAGICLAGVGLKGDGMEYNFYRQNLLNIIKFGL